MDRWRVSKRLKFELLNRRLDGEPQYRLAARAGVHHTTLSALLHDTFPVGRQDARVLRLGALLGIPEHECFEPVRGEPVDHRTDEGPPE